MVFFITFALFYEKSYYSYILNFYTSGQIGSIVEREKLVKSINTPFVDEDGDTFYLDDASWVVKEKESYLEFGGRYYTHRAAIKEKKKNQVEAIMNKRLIDFFARDLCLADYRIIAKNQNFIQEIDKLKNQEVNCVSDLKMQLKGHFKLFFFLLDDSNRNLKLVFISLIISIFFGVVTYGALKLTYDKK